MLFGNNPIMILRLAYQLKQDCDLCEFPFQGVSRYQLRLAYQLKQDCDIQEVFVSRTRWITPIGIPAKAGLRHVTFGSRRSRLPLKSDWLTS